MWALLVSLVVGSVAVPVSVTAFSSRAGDRIRLTAVAEPGAPGIKLRAASITLRDATGKVAGQWSPKPAELAKLTAATLVTTFDVLPGTYHVHAAITDAAGAKGTADATVSAGLTRAAGSLTLGSIVLGTSAIAGANGPAGTFAPHLRFSGESAATAMFELYGGSTGMQVSVEMDVSSTAEGPAIATLKPTIAATPEPDRFIVTAPIDLTTLSPGDYVVRAIVGLDGQPATTIVGVLRRIS